MEIAVTYACWGCESQVVQYEDIEENIPSLEKWNICPDCKEGGKGNGSIKESLG